MRVSLVFLSLSVLAVGSSCTGASPEQDRPTSKDAIAANFELIVSDPVHRKSWLANGQLLPSYYDPKLYDFENVGGGYTGEHREDGPIGIKGLPGEPRIFYAKMTGTRNQVVPDAVFLLPDPPCTSMPIRKGIESYTEPFMKWPCNFRVDCFLASPRPSEISVRFGYSDEQWKTAGVFVLSSRIASGLPFVGSYTVSGTSASRFRRELVIRFPKEVLGEEHRILAFDSRGREVPYSDFWNLNGQRDHTDFQWPPGFTLDQGSEEITLKSNVMEIIREKTPGILSRADKVVLQVKPWKWKVVDSVRLDPIQ